MRGRNLDGAVRDGARPDRRVRRGLGLDEMTASGRNGYDRAERNRTMRGRSGPEGNRAGTGRARDWTRPNGAPRDWTARTGPDRIGRDTGRGQGSATRFYSRKKQTAHCECFCPWRVEQIIICPSPLAVAANPVSTESCDALGDSAATAKRNPFHIPTASFEINGRRGRRKQR